MLAAIVAASTLASCGDDVSQSARDGDRRAVLKQKHKGYRPGGDTIKVKSQPQAKEQDDSRAPKAEGGGAEEPAGDTRPDDHGNTQRPKGNSPQKPVEPAESCASDLSGDMEGAGAMPAYADLQRGCLREEGGDLVLAATTVSAAPGRMPDRNTNLAIGFELTTKSGESIYVGAEATDGGWSAYLSKDGGSRTIGAPEIRGDQLVLVIPVSELGDTEEWSWNVESSWLRATLTSTEYAFDDAPNGNVSTFDRG